ncbi:MAG: hypothetical protein VW454_03445 [Pelagibacteraceae bacterium]
MSNYYKNKLRERLTYCQDWKHSIDMYLANKEITKQTDKEYYKSRPLLKIVLDVYFLPYNLLKFVRYLRMRHEYKKNQIEIEVLSEKLNQEKNWRNYEI